MPNLKLDLVNGLNNEKMYAELELVRLAQEPNMNYKTKIAEMNQRLEELVILDAKLGLVEKYFQEPPVPQAAPAPQGQPVQQAPQGKVHQGQSHGE
jgi:hypothetical protein